tara:strand:+ start:878 stop:1726 length:849 start_codon:yes stop_codon:yes gene_type:complete
MEYKTGFTVKPYEVTALGQVVFSDGTDTLIPNQLQCEAYGYTYDRVTGTCRSFRYTPSLPASAQNINNRLNGAGNTTQTGSNTIQMNGTGNTTRGLNNNCFINGRDNEIANNINNATVNGSLGIALRQGEVVLGGGSFNIAAGLTQSSKIQLSTKTTDATATTLQVQDLTDAFIEMQRDSILGLEIHLTRLETGGTAGTVGNFHYLVIKGAARCDHNGVIILYTHSTTTIASLGLQGSTIALYDSTTSTIPSITVRVADLANINNTWSATAYLHELRTTIPF